VLVVEVVVVLVEPVTPPAEPELVSVELVGGEVPLLPMELVLPVVPEPVDPVPPVDGLVEGLGVVVDEPVEPVEPVVASRLLHALNERAATTARVAAAHWVKDVFIRNS
jgi:hypothetical protein